jgi:hypothetical protein
MILITSFSPADPFRRVCQGFMISTLFLQTGGLEVPTARSKVEHPQQTRFGGSARVLNRFLTKMIRISGSQQRV